MSAAQQSLLSFDFCRPLSSSSSSTWARRCPCCGGGRTAIELSCMHVVCAACVNKARGSLLLLDKVHHHHLGGAPKILDKSVVGRFLCPFCHEETEISSDALPDRCVLKRPPRGPAAVSENGVRSRLSSVSESLLRLRYNGDEDDDGGLALAQKGSPLLVRRLSLLAQCKFDLEFLASLFPKAALPGSEFAGAVARRFSAVERILDLQRPSDIYCCCLDLSMVPFEKVLCQIPFSIVTRDGKVAAAAAEVDLWLDKGLSVAIVVEGQSCPVSVKTFLTPSWSILEFVPPNPGMASVTFAVLGCRMSVYPNSFEVLPLAL